MSLTKAINEVKENILQEDRKAGKYKKGEIERPTQYGKDAVTLQVDRKILTSELVMKNKELRTTLNALGVVSGRPPLLLIITADPLLAASKLVLPKGSSHLEHTTEILTFFNVLRI